MVCGQPKILADNLIFPVGCLLDNLFFFLMSIAAHYSDNGYQYAAREIYEKNIQTLIHRKL